MSTDVLSNYVAYWLLLFKLLNGGDGVLTVTDGSYKNTCEINGLHLLNKPSLKDMDTDTHTHTHTYMHTHTHTLTVPDCITIVTRNHVPSTVTIMLSSLTLL